MNRVKANASISAAKGRRNRAARPTDQKVSSRMTKAVITTFIVK
ncbi:MAG: hypothetical protein WKF75_04400 [Singulisphaera sp.]